MSDVTDGEVAGERFELAARERVGDKPLLLPLMETVTVGRDDAGRFLPTMLQGMKPEVGDVGRLGVAVHADDTAHTVSLLRRTVI